MSMTINSSTPDDVPNDSSPVPAGDGQAGRQSSRLRSVLRVVEVRLRFVVVFAIAFVVVSQWSTLRNYWDRWTSLSSGDAPETVSSDTEYFCPMDPGVISGWPGKCPVCNMALVRRKKGSAGLLPEGVVARMQVSPYRLQLAGVRTSAAAYRPLARTIVAPAWVRAEESSLDRDVAASTVYVELDVDRTDAALLKPGHSAEVTCPARPGQGPWSARVRTIRFDSPEDSTRASVRIEIDNRDPALVPGMEVSTAIKLAVADMEPFRSQPVDPEPLGDDEPRRAFVCPNHANVFGSPDGKCPRDGVNLVELPLADNQRLRYWCPMHPGMTAREPGKMCDDCTIELVPRILTYRPRGEVLTVPETAVIDTGERPLVYVDRGGGMFEGVEVVVGPRADGYLAILSGLQAGQKVASTGAFLLDAETRLSRNLATAYFGATTNPAASDTGTAPTTSIKMPGDDATPGPAAIEAALAKLAPDDQRLARMQKTCPVTGLVLGSMNTPVKVTVGGRVVFLCCSGCVAPLRDHPEKYLPQAGGTGQIESPK
ncbi:MAG: heavy metal-binding domain-containing protein [Pirellulales bacterium]